MEKEKWKEDVMNSLQGLQSAEPSSFLFTRIEARLKEPVGLPQWQLGLAGISMVLLLVINVWVMNSASTTTENTNSLTTTYRY